MRNSTPIDRESFEPPYAQLARTIRERVGRGEYRPGDRLPSEAELCAAFEVSPMTVRRAIGELVRDDVVVTEHGRGTFVKPPQLAAATFDLADLTRYLANPDIEAHILEARIVSAGPRVAEKLAVAEHDRVISIKRLLLRGEEPVFYHSEYLVFDPARPLVEAELATTALQDLFSGASGCRPQVRAAHAPRLGVHRAGGGAPGRDPRRTRLGPRASLLRLRRPPGELGPVRRPRGPAELHDHRGRRGATGRSVTP